MRKTFELLIRKNLGKRTHSITVLVLLFILFYRDRKNFTEVNWEQNMTFVFWCIYVPRFVSLDIQEFMLERPEKFIKMLKENVCLVARF